MKVEKKRYAVDIIIALIEKDMLTLEHVENVENAFERIYKITGCHRSSADILIAMIQKSQDGKLADFENIERLYKKLI